MSNLHHPIDPWIIPWELQKWYMRMHAYAERQIPGTSNWASVQIMVGEFVVGYACDALYYPAVVFAFLVFIPFVVKDRNTLGVTYFRVLFQETIYVATSPFWLVVQ